MTLITLSIVIILSLFSFIFTSIDKKLRNIENQNERIIKVLEDIRGKQNLMLV